MNMHRFIALFFVVAVLGISLTVAQSQPVRDRVLGDVRIEDRDECALVTIGFEFPVRYIRHFPQSSGEELRIQLEPISVSPTDQDALTHREAIKPPPSDIAFLAEAIYEGDITGGPFLTLMFSHPVQFKVGQGSDFRSLVVAVPLPESNMPCEPQTAKGKSNSKKK